MDDDYTICRQLAQTYPTVQLPDPFRSPIEAKSYIAGLDFFTGARMHSCIAAFSSGVPVVPMAYSRKFNGLFDSLGYRHYADLLEDSEDVVLSAVLTGLKQREVLQADLASGLHEAKTRLQRYSDYLSDLIRESCET